MASNVSDVANKKEKKGNYMFPIGQRVKLSCTNDNIMYTNFFLIFRCVFTSTALTYLYLHYSRGQRT
jgi:hypothetical protein